MMRRLMRIGHRIPLRTLPAPLALIALVGLALTCAFQPAWSQPASLQSQRDLRTLETAEAELARRFGRNTPAFAAQLSAVLAEQVEVEPGGRIRSLRPGPAGTPQDARPQQVLRLDRDPRYREALRRELEDQKAEIRQRTTIRIRIIRGRSPLNENNVDVFPHAVALIGSNGKLCSGVLVGRRAVLTAKHCVCDIGLGGGSTVVFGTAVVSSTRYRISRMSLYGRQGCRTDADLYGYDLAVALLERRVEAAAAVPIGALHKLAPGEPLWVAGFGLDEKDNLGRKLVARIRVVSPLCGGAGDDRAYGCVPGREGVLIDPSGRDSCGGDSGGPAYFQDAATRSLHLVAIVSRGRPPGLPCGKGGVYTLLNPEAVRWLVRSIGDHETRNPPPDAVVSVLTPTTPTMPPATSVSSNGTGETVHRASDGGFKACTADCRAGSASLASAVQCSRACVCRYQCAGSADAKACAAYCRYDSGPGSGE